MNRPTIRIILSAQPINRDILIYLLINELNLKYFFRIRIKIRWQNKILLLKDKIISTTKKFVFKGLIKYCL